MGAAMRRCDSSPRIAYRSPLCIASRGRRKDFGASRWEAVRCPLAIRRCRCALSPLGAWSGGVARQFLHEFMFELRVLQSAESAPVRSQQVPLAFVGVSSLCVVVGVRAPYCQMVHLDLQ